jgi:hypothetical protein
MATFANRNQETTARRAHNGKPRSRTKRFFLEELEVRCLLDGGFRSITGVGNNLANPTFGAAGTDLIRIASPAYADGLNAPAGPNRPDARVVSNTLSDQTDPANPSQDLNTINQKLLSDYIYVFGQLLDHDLDLTKDSSGQPFDIPPGSATDPMGAEPFTRSQFDPSTGPSAVDLSGAFNRVGIVNDGSTFFGGGLDHGGNALSATLLGSSVVFSFGTYNLGSAGVKDVVSTAGQTISLPATNAATVSLLATGVNGNQSNQEFEVTYTDGSTQTFRQSISDWFTPQNYAGESTAVTMPYRDTANGGTDNRTFQVYGYSFTVNSAKRVQSIELPNDSNVEVLAIDVTPNTPRQQIQSITSFIDGSQIYGSDPTTADALRAHTGGRLKVQIEDGAEFLPFNSTDTANGGIGTPIDMANDAHIVANSQVFAAGDRRANENIELTSMQTLFVREHNRIADQVAAAHPTWSDEQIYQTARKIVGAELEIITYNEWIPALLGPNALPAYTGYNPNVNPGIANEFSTAMFRFAHSELDNGVDRLNNDGTDIADPAGGTVDLATAFFNPTLIQLPAVTDPFSGHLSSGISPILKGAASGNAQEVDLLAVRDIRNFLFGPPGAGGTDLIARDIQRGRDHGLTDYNSMRAAYNLPRVTSFAQITSNVTVQQELQQVYGNVNNIDAFVGALAEDHAPGADVGPLTRAVLVNQFTRLRDGDRFFYLNQLSATDVQTLQANTSLAKIIERNTAISNLQANVFFFKVSIRGTAFDDDNRNGTLDNGEHGLAGVTVQLLDSSGTVVSTTRTDANGRYLFNNFNGLDATGSYTVAVVVPSGFVSTSPVSVGVAISRGDINAIVSFGLDESSSMAASVLVSTSSGGARAPASARTATPPSRGGGLGSIDLPFGGFVTNAGPSTRDQPAPASVVTISRPAAATPGASSVVTVSVPPGGGGRLTLFGAADPGAATPGDPLASPDSNLDRPGVTVL